MVKVLVVDDEPFVRQGLRAIIDWNEYGFELCGEAENGLAALEMIEEHHPHVVITDIKMPGIDGLELIRKSMSELKCSSKFIILSGYEDFNYAKTAIKYNVKGYILKPVEESELLDILIKIKEEVQAESLNEIRQHASIKALAAQTVKRLILGEAGSEDIHYSKQWLGINESDQLWYMIIDADDCGRTPDSLNGAEAFEVRKKLEDTIYESVGRENALNVYPMSIRQYGIVVNRNIVKKGNGTINGLTERIGSGFNKSEEAFVRVFVGAEVKGVSNLRYSYDSCLKTMEYLYLYPLRQVFFYEEVKRTPFSYYPTDIQFFVKLQEDIENSRLNEIVSNVEALLKQMQEKHMAPEIIKACLIKFELENVRIITDMNGDVGEIFRKNLTANMKINRIDLLMADFIAFCKDCAKYYKSLREKKSSGILCDIEKYIHRNFKNEISLKSIGEAFYINPVYLGQLFKKQFGLFFNDYLNRLRMEEAMKLLRRTDYKIYEIAQMVGYPDTNYFISKFEKYCSMTPTQYKKNGVGTM